MNVTASARQVTDYTFRLTEGDLERYLADPIAWANDVRAQLGLPAAGAGEVKANRATTTRKGAARKKADGGRRAASPARGGG